MKHVDPRKQLMRTFPRRRLAGMRDQLVLRPPDVDIAELAPSDDPVGHRHSIPLVFVALAAIGGDDRLVARSKSPRPPTVGPLEDFDTGIRLLRHVDLPLVAGHASAILPARRHSTFGGRRVPSRFETIFGDAAADASDRHLEGDVPGSYGCAVWGACEALAEAVPSGGAIAEPACDGLTLGLQWVPSDLRPHRPLCERRRLLTVRYCPRTRPTRPTLGISVESARRRSAQADIDDGIRDGLGTSERTRFVEL